MSQIGVFGGMYLRELATQLTPPTAPVAAVHGWPPCVRAAGGGTALCGEAHCEQGVPCALLEKPVTHGTHHFVEVDLGEDAFFDVIVDRSEGFEQARFAARNRVRSSWHARSAAEYGR